MSENVITMQPINHDLTKERTDIASMISDLDLMSDEIDPSEVQYDMANDKSIQKEFNCLQEMIDVVYKEHQQMILPEIETSKELLDHHFPRNYLEKSFQELIQKILFKGQTITPEFVISLDDLIESSQMAKLYKERSQYLEGVSNIFLEKYHLLAHDWADKVIYHFQKTIELFCQKNDGLITLKSFKAQKKGSLFHLNPENDQVKYYKPIQLFPQRYVGNLDTCGCFWYKNSGCTGFTTIFHNSCSACLDVCCCTAGWKEQNIIFNPSQSDQYTNFSHTSLLTINCMQSTHQNKIINPLDGQSNITINLVLDLEPITSPSIILKDFSLASLCSESSLQSLNPSKIQIFNSLKQNTKY